MCWNVKKIKSSQRRGRDNRDLQKNKKKRELAIIKVQDQNNVIKESRKKNKIVKQNTEKRIQNTEKRIQNTEKRIIKIKIIKHIYMKRR